MAADTCRLCLRSVDKEKSSNLLTETTKLGMLKEFLPELNLDFSENTQVCDRCVEELETSYNFKQGVVVYEANIQAKLEGKKQKKIDLKLMLDAIAKKELKKSDYICRTCLSICRTPSISLFESPSNMMPYNFVKKMCEVVFELEFIASTKPVLCDDCWETLQTVYNFRKSCLRTDKRLRVYVASNNITKLSVDEFKKFAEENPVKDDDEVSSDDELDGYVKDEPIDEEELKFDPDEASCSSSSVKVKEETIVKCESEINSDDEDIEDEPELLDPKAVKSEASELDGEDCKMEIGDVKVDVEGEGVAGTSGMGMEDRAENTCYLDVERTKPYKCIQCSYRCNKKSNLKKHFLIHLPEEVTKRYKCPDCSYSTKHKHDLKRHCMRHEEDKTIDQELFTPKEQQLIQDHQFYFPENVLDMQTNNEYTPATDVSDIIKRYKCPNCIYSTNSKANLNRHLLRYLPGESTDFFKCPHCEYSSKFNYDLKRHSVVHLSERPNLTFACSLCGYKVGNKYQLTKHKISHLPEDIDKYLTKNMKLPSVGGLYKCSNCAYSTANICNFKKHLTKYLSKGTNQLKCPECSYTSNSKMDLKAHQIVHLKIFHCTVCPYKTKGRGTLREHMSLHSQNNKEKHDINNPYKCTTCNYNTKDRGNFRRHCLRHLPDEATKVHKCSECGYSSKFKHDLRRHRARHVDQTADTISMDEQC